MKERIKSFILVLLVFMSLYLTSKTWITERLWPDGYSLFANVKEWPIISGFFKNEYSLPMENLGKARKIVIADGSGASAVFYDGDKTFDSVYSEIKSFMADFLEGKLEVKSTLPLAKENVRQMLNEQVMYAYINYPVAVTPQFFGQISGIKDSRALSNLSAVRDFFILPAGRQSVEFIAVDYESQAVMRYSVGYERALELIDIFQESAKDVSADRNCMLALQMNMDIDSPDAPVKTKTLLDSFLVLDSASTAISSGEEILSINPLGEEIPEEIVTLFGYNPESIRRYVDSNGTVIYLENDSSLKIYKNGLIEFEALSPSFGIPIEGGQSLYGALNGAIRFSGKVYKSSGAEDKFNMNVSKDLLFESGGELNFGFDYYFEGTPITARIEKEGLKMNHAAEITVENGSIVKFSMLLREYEKTGREKELMNIYGAIDKVALDNSESDIPVWINDMFLSYEEAGESEILSPVWSGLVNGERTVITD